MHKEHPLIEPIVGMNQNILKSMLRGSLQKSILDLKLNTSKMGMSVTEQEGCPLELLELMTF